MFYCTFTVTIPKFELLKDVNVLWWFSVILLLILILREALQLGVAPRRYFFSFENWLEITLIILTSVLLFMGNYCYRIEAKRHISAIIIVISWSELITMIGRHPALTIYNIYVTMFYKVHIMHIRNIRLNIFIIYITVHI